MAKPEDSALPCHQVLTDGGLLAAVHNGDGHVMWSHHYGSDAAPTLLVPWRSSHDVQHAPEVQAPLLSNRHSFAWCLARNHAVHITQHSLKVSRSVCKSVRPHETITCLMLYRN